MKHKITRKLILYFSVLIAIFTLIMGSLFTYFFMHQSTAKSIEDLKVQANKIAETLSRNSENIETAYGQNGHANGKHGQTKNEIEEDYARDISLLDASVQGNVWIVDKNAKAVHVGHGKHHINYNDFPKEADSLLESVFDGKTESSQSFSSILEAPYITIGAPIYNSKNEIIAVVLLHTELSYIESGIRDGIIILILSLVISLMFAIILAIILAKKFVMPLNRMEEVTKKITNGDYKVRTNISQRDEIGSLALHIDTLVERLDENDKYMSQIEQSRKDFMTKIAHELRTPVTVIRGSLEALRDGIVKDSNKIQEYYEQMLLDSIHLERMINDLLELSRLQNPDYVIKKTRENIVSILSDVIRSLRLLAIDKNINIKYEYNEEILEMNVDYVRIRQMFVIVLDNAIKFSNRDSEVIVSIHNNVNEFIVTIRDKGCGINTKDLSSIFNKFYSSDTQANVKGSGLGLAIAKEIAERHEIQIEINSTIMVGTTVNFIFHKLV